MFFYFMKTKFLLKFVKLELFMSPVSVPVSLAISIYALHHHPSHSTEPPEDVTVPLPSSNNTEQVQREFWCLGTIFTSFGIPKLRLLFLETKTLSENSIIIKFEKDLQDHPGQQSIYHQYFPTELCCLI